MIEITHAEGNDDQGNQLVRPILLRGAFAYLVEVLDEQTIHHHIQSTQPLSSIIAGEMLRAIFNEYGIELNLQETSSNA